MFVNLFRPLRVSDRARTAALVLVFLTLAGAALTADLPPDGDDVSYITLAQALASGRGYLTTIYPEEQPEPVYPPLFPLLLTPLVAVLGPNLFLLKLVPVLGGALALTALFALLRPRLGPDRAFLIAALTGTSGYYLSMSTQVMSETIYLALSAAGLILIHRAETAGGGRATILAGLIIVVAIYTRTIGIALALAACGTLLLRRRLREVLILAGVFLVLVSPWVWRSISLQDSYLYRFQVSLPGAEGQTGPLLWFSRLLYNAPRYAGKVMADLFFHPFLADVTPYHPLKVGLSLALTAGITAGFFSRVKEAVTNHESSRLTSHVSRLAQNVDCELLYLLLYVGVCLIWPYHDARFLLPVLPFLFERLLRGAEWAGRRLRFKRSADATAGLLMALGLAGCVYIAYGNHAHFYKDEMLRYREACLWIQENAPPDAVVLCRKPREAAFWSGRRAWWYTGTQPVEEVLATVRKMGITHLLINDFPIAGINLAERFSTMMRKEERRFRLTHQTGPPRMSIYEVLDSR